MKNKGQGIIPKKENIIQRWWHVSQPHTGYLIGQVSTYAIYVVFLSIITIFAAKTINYMYLGNWNNAFLFLGLELFTIIARNVALHLEYKFYCKQNGYIRLNLSQKIFNKCLSCKNESMKDLTVEKITNIALNNMAYASEFPDIIAIFCGSLVQVVFTLVVVYLSNPLAGLIVTALGVVNFFAYHFFNKKLGKIMLERFEKKDDMFKSYSKIIGGRNVINELNAKDKYREELISNVQSFNNAYTKYFITTSWKNNLYFAIWNVVVYAITALMLYFVSQGTLSIEVYLIIIPYLTSCTNKLCTLFDQSSALENMRVDVDRINLILGMSDEELIQYGNLNKDDAGYKLGLVDVSEYKKPGQKYSLENVNMTFETGKINVVKGPKDNGKRVIFDILRRHNVPDKGMAVLDNLNLFDYNNSTFQSHISYCSSYPDFINGTIKENLAIVDKDIQNIEKICAELGILNEIQILPKKFDTNINEISSSTTLFMIGVVRALLSNCKILMIYEFPSEVSESTKQRIIKLVTHYNIDKTLIIFTHSDSYDSIASVVYNIDKGIVTKTKG